MYHLFFCIFFEQHSIACVVVLNILCVLSCSECVECLLEHNAKVLVYDNITKRTPLHAAGNCC